MNPINPLASSIVQSGHVQRQQAAHKDHQLRRELELAKNVALQDDQLEHQVESSEEIRAIHDDENTTDNPSRRKRRQSTLPSTTDDDDPSDHQIDLTA